MGAGARSGVRGARRLIAVDANVLVYAHRRDADLHEPAARALTRLAESPAPWAIPWPCLHEFLAIVTHRRIFSPPSTTAQAAAQVDAWLEAPGLVLLGEGPDHWPRLRGLLATGRIAGPRVHDARVAAVCLTHGVRELWTADRDFSRFGELRTHNPLLG